MRGRLEAWLVAASSLACVDIALPTESAWDCQPECGETSSGFTTASGSGSSASGGEEATGLSGYDEATATADGSSGDGDGSGGDGDGSGGDGDGGDGDGDGDGDGGDGDGTSGDGDGTSGDGDGCDACDPLGARRCSPSSPILVQTCDVDPVSGCQGWSDSIDCTTELANSEAFCDPTSSPATCQLTEPCATQNPTVTFEPPSVVLVVDHSGSMYLNGIGPGLNRWDGLLQVVDTVTLAYENRIDFGVKWFPSAGAGCPTMDSKCNVTPWFDVAPAPFNNQQLMAHLSSLGGFGSCSTPTQSAMEQSRVAMDAFLPAGSAGAFMLIIDGGVAEFCPGNDQAGTIAAIESAAATGLPTFVVGIDAGASADADAYAIAGGQPNPDPNYAYYPGDDLAQLNAALESIAAELAPCEIQLGALPPVAGSTEVIIGGMAYPQIGASECASATGWYFSNPSGTSITLCGAACAAFQTELTAEVNYYCLAS